MNLRRESGFLENMGTPGKEDMVKLEHNRPTDLMDLNCPVNMVE
jgi:hypothetical protein